MERDLVMNTQKCLYSNFNSHAHVERDSYVVATDNGISDFNSHAHVERDQINIPTSIKFTNFNSHAHVERDQSETKAIRKKTISTHTLTWSVTPMESLEP